MLHPEFKEFIKLLNIHKVKYLVAGGYAVIYHGYNRLTKDLDIWILMDKDNAHDMLSVLKDFGFTSLGLKEADFLQPNTFIQLGYPPIRINLMTEMVGLNFQECYARREILSWADNQINFIDKQSLIINKKASGRLQDLADVENLES